jgi:hypothetical protein
VVSKHRPPKAAPQQARQVFLLIEKPFDPGFPSSLPGFHSLYFQPPTLVPCHESRLTVGPPRLHFCNTI